MRSAGVPVARRLRNRGAAGPLALTIAWLALWGCGAGARDEGAARTASTPAAGVDTSVPRGVGAGSAAGAEGAARGDWLNDTAWATANDAWNVAEVKRRLAEAGFVVADSGRVARQAPLGVPGRVLGVGSGTLALYVYPSRAARESDARGLDTAGAPGAIPTLDRPRYIIANNLVAVLRTPSDRLAERVSNVLLARHLGR